MLEAYREKWREAPRGSDADGRIYSSDLLRLPDTDLLATWEAMAARRYAGELGWVGDLYRDTFRDRRVLELGSGLGFDGLRFAAWGATWIFADIVPDNLQLIRRIAALKRLESRVHFHLIPDSLTFDGVPGPLDAIWVFGSIHHVPFAIARQEAREALSLLRVGGRWLELVYPRERWLREGSLPFDRWGKLTDGDRTPWAEWHDAEKVRERLAPASLRTILNFPFCSSNYEWIDFRFEGFAAAQTGAATDLLKAPVQYARRTRRPLVGQAVACPDGVFSEVLRIALAPRPRVTVEIDILIKSGAIGLYLVDAADRQIPAAEAILVARQDSHRLTLRGDGAKSLLVRNMHDHHKGRFQFLALTQT